ncbi:hypothetical protein [Hasllibacter sp. MH4015]|uniref:hypothetical protein n=1 Tax=Hasllibacter sp. MH4015 TaxID=2854029 RepID=UPI001CD1CAC4|nr:hypothetical protein [Hasllibacter sp. MH4015]
MTKAIANGPMYAAVGYLILGVTIATVGPLEYSGFLPTRVFGFILCVAVFFAVGYYLGVRAPVQRRQGATAAGNARLLRRIFNICIVLTSVVMTFELLRTIATGGLTLSFADAALSYFSAYDGYTRNTGRYSLNFIITSLVAPALFVSQILGIFYFRKIGLPAKIAVIYLLIVQILVFTLGAGKQKQFADIIIYIVTIIVANQASTGRLRMSVLLKAAALIFAGIYVLLVLLANRYGAIGVDLATLNVNLHPLITYRYDSALEQYLGPELSFPLVMFSSYLAQGYYGLSLAFEQDFTWTAFAGSSYSVSVILNQFFGAPFMVEESYPYIVGASTGWAETKWHTVFAWLASDLTFPGVLVFMGFVGFLYGKTWREILLYRNPLSLAVFAMLNIGLAYAPANNQLMHSPGPLFTLFVVLFLYFRFRARFNAAPAELRTRGVRIRL